MVSIQTLLNDLDQKQAAQTRLAAYAGYTLDVEPALHHHLICDAIDDLLEDHYDELIILAPPGSAKSWYTSIALPSYFMGKNPTKAILTCSYSTELAEKWGRRVRNQISAPRHAALFPECQLSKDSQSAGRWATTKNGELYAAGVGSGILGFRADLAVIDDPISGFEEAQSETQLAKVHGWYETDFITRLKPQAKVVLICQRLARNDLAGYLIDRNIEKPTRRQRIIKLKMEAELDDPLGRQPGERLWPEWFTQEMVEDAKRDDYKWRTLYQQEPPSDTGSWVSPEEIQIVDIIPDEDRLKHYLLSDLALSVNKGDYSVHLTVGVDDQMNIYFKDAWRDRCAPDKTVEKHLELVSTYHPQESLIDDDNASKVYVQLLARMSRENSVSVPYRAMPMRGQDKETRAAALRGWFKRKKVFFKRAPWNRWLIEQFLAFPNAIGVGVDDGVDAASLIGRRLVGVATPATEQAPKPPPKTWQDATLNEMWEDREHGGRNAKRI